MGIAATLTVTRLACATSLLCLLPCTARADDELESPLEMQRLALERQRLTFAFVLIAYASVSIGIWLAWKQGLISSVHLNRGLEWFCTPLRAIRTRLNSPIVRAAIASAISKVAARVRGAAETLQDSASNYARQEEERDQHEPSSSRPSSRRQKKQGQSSGGSAHCTGRSAESSTSAEMQYLSDTPAACFSDSNDELPSSEQSARRSKGLARFSDGKKSAKCSSKYAQLADVNVSRGNGRSSKVGNTNGAVGSSKWAKPAFVGSEHDDEFL